MKSLQEQLEFAIQLAVIMHGGQKDKAGEPYILHPLAIMNNVSGIKCKIVAVLHDIVEDTEIDEDELLLYDFDKEIVDAIMVLTKPKQQEYMDYIELVGKNKLARKVKLADLEHNMDLTRIPGEITNKDLTRNKKYQKAYNYLIEDELQYDTTRKFQVKCLECGSFNVSVEEEIDYDYEENPYVVGSNLTCKVCGNIE